MYVVLDDQSNVSLSRTAFFDVYKVQETAEPYVLKTCAGVVSTMGSCACGYVVKPHNGAVSIPPSNSD